MKKNFKRLASIALSASLLFSAIPNYQVMAKNSMVSAATISMASAMGSWGPGNTYKIGDLVTFSGKTYRCTQPHTAINGWEPAVVPAIWSLTNDSPPVVPTNPVVPGPTPAQ